MRSMFRFLHRLLLCLCTAAGFAGMAALLHRLAPLHVPEVTPKLDYLKAHLGDFDTVFIGSSRIYHGVSPRIFDATMSTSGSATHSFNLAINGMMPPESLQMARTLIALHPPNLRRLFLEVSSTRDVPELKTLTVRDIYWQDIEALKYGIRRAPLDYRKLQGKYKWPKAWDDVTISALLFARNQFNIGRLIPTPDFATVPQERMGDSTLGPDRDGFLPELHPLTPPQRAKLEKGIQDVLNGTAKSRPRDPLNTAGYISIRNLLEKHGIQLVLITAPVTTRDFNAKQDAPAGEKVLAFDDPARFPELFTPEHRFDYDHLNGDGALIFSKELAAAYLAGK